MQSQSRAVLPLLILIILGLVCLFLARAEASEPGSGDLAAMLQGAGGWLAYADESGRIYLRRPDGAQTLPVGYGQSLAWSPDGRQVVLDASWQVDLQTGQEMVLYAQNDGRRANRSLWLPHRDSWLTFSSQEAGLYVSPLPALLVNKEIGTPDQDAVSSSGATTLVADGSLGLFTPQSVAPDGRRVALVRRDEADLLAAVSILDLETGQETPVELPRPAAVIRDYVYYFAWSPVGHEVLFTWATATDAGSGPPERLQLMRVGAEGGSAQPLLLPQADGSFTAAAWSPDGSAIACYRIAADESLRPAVSVYVLYNVARAGGPSRMEHAGSALTTLPPGDTATSPLYWSPDGQVLYFSVRDRRTGVSSLRLVTRDGREARLLANDRNLYSLGWLPYSGDVHLPYPPQAPPDGWPGTSPAEPGGASAQVAYDRAGAVGYALSHCTEDQMYCPVGISYAENSIRCASGGDCAHFVSHCLYAGGLSNFGSIGVGHNLSGTACYVTGGIIIRAVNQHDWLLSGGRGVARAAATQLDQGDVMAYDWDGVNSWNHVAFIVHNDGRGDARVASHTRYGCDFDWSMGGAAVYEFIHVLAAPAAPRLPDPPSGATITQATPALRWAAVGTSHSVQIATDPTFTTLLADAKGLSAPEFAIASPLAPGAYYWRAQVSSTDGVSPWSEVWSFRVEEPCTRPPPPSPTFPTDVYTACVTTPPDLAWTTVVTATSYQIEWTDPLSQTQIWTTTVTALTLPGPLTSGEYRWRIRAANDCGPGLWSASRSLWLVAAPGRTTSHTPPDGSITVEMRPTFTWAALTDAVSYTLQLAAAPGFEPLIWQAEIGAPATRPLAPLELGRYAWRVRGHNVCGAGEWSATATLQVVDALRVYLPIVSHSPPPACRNLIANGGFETDATWTRGGLRPPVYVTDQSVSGQRSLLLGVKPPARDVYAYSSAYQIVTVPEGATSATLGLWLQRHTEDTAGDRQQFMILNERAQVERVLMNLLSNDGVWSYAEFDLSGYAGQTICIYLNVTNDGDGARTWMYVDDLSLAVCP
jgi:hypothetical protein